MLTTATEKKETMEMMKKKKKGKGKTTIEDQAKKSISTKKKEEEEESSWHRKSRELKMEEAEHCHEQIARQEIGWTKKKKLRERTYKLWNKDKQTNKLDSRFTR